MNHESKERGYQSRSFHMLFWDFETLHFLWKNIWPHRISISNKVRHNAS